MGIVKCPKCGNSENLHTNYDYGHKDMPIIDFLCNECGELFYDSYYDTLKHINKVRHNMAIFVDDLNKRAMVHDKSKLEAPEKEYFDKYTPELKDLEYGTPEYRESIKRLKPAIDHHMANNDHHSEFHGEDGINGMNLISLCEMLCDWKASIDRGKNGDILKSLNINAERKGISKQLRRIMLNTIEYLNWDKKDDGGYTGGIKKEKEHN